MKMTREMRLLAGTAAVVAFNSVTPALADNAFVHPLLQPGSNGKYYNAYAERFSSVLRKESDDMMAGGAAGSFVVNLEAKLKEGPLNRPQMVWSSPEVTPNVLLVGGVVPPATMFQTAAIPFCADKNMQIVFKGHITPKGEVVPDNSAFSTPISAGRRPCQDWLLAKGKAMMQPAPDKATAPPVSAAATVR